MRSYITVVLFISAPIMLPALAQHVYAQNSDSCYLVLPNGDQINLDQICGANISGASRTPEALPSVEELADLYPYVNPSTRPGLWYLHQGRQAEAQAEFSKLRSADPNSFSQ